MKKGSEWLVMLPKEIQRKWIRETILQHGKDFARFVLNQEMDGMCRLIAGSFTWSKSKDGLAFWQNLFMQHENK